jgi:type II secretory ATPase GspE/PulE/Tfp pilus assembly ATPase PilB-like protein
MFNGEPENEADPQDGRILLEADSLGRLEVRVSTFPTVFGERVRLRLQGAGESLGWDGLGLRGKNRKLLEEILSQPYGLVLLSGPSGSGKSLTARAALTWLAERSAGRHCIMTLEEPVETFLPGVTQTHVDSSGPMGWPQALKGLLRQDPDIIYCGAVPSAAMATQILSAALGGHLVLAQFTSLDAATALQGFAETGLEPLQRHQLGMLWQGLVTQRLARMICPHCKTRTADGYYRGEGCEQCRQTGMKGRTGVYQIVPREESLAPLLQQSRPLGEIRAELERLGHPSLADCAMQLAREGVITLEEALRCSS